MTDAARDGRTIEPFDFSEFGLAEMLRCGRGVRAAAAGATSMEGAARGIVRYLYDAARDGATGARSCALVRCFATCPYGQLGPALQEVAALALGSAEPPPDEMRCLTLLATAGDEPAWNSRHASRGHQAIPLASTESMRAAPMIAELVRALGIDAETLVRPEAGTSHDDGGKTYNVFHVPEALGSPFIPAQAEFVVPHGIRSVLGFGAELTRGDVVAVLLFSRAPIPAAAASRFRNVALDVKASLFVLSETRVFEDGGAT